MTGPGSNFARAVQVSRLVVIALLVVGCGAATSPEARESATPTDPSPSATAGPVTPTPEPDPQPDYVEVDGASLAYECMGSGSPAVIFEHGNPPPGFEAYDPDWGGARVTIEAIAEFTQACIYGRRGFMGSDPVDAASRTAAEQVADLGGFIDAVGIQPPVILVGYSWGGELVRLFAGEHPEAVAGLVLVDSSHPDADAAYGSTPGPPEPPEMIDFETSHEQVRAVTDLGDLPIAILTSGEPFPGAPQEVFDTWFELQADLMSLSTNASSVRVDGVNHFEIAASFEEIAEAVRTVMSEAARR